MKENNRESVIQSAPTGPNDKAQLRAAQSENDAESADGALAAASCSPGSICTIEEIMFGDLGKDPKSIDIESAEDRDKGIAAINSIVWNLDKITQNKSLEWELRMMSARISKYIDTVMDQKDHCGLVPLFP